MLTSLIIMRKGRRLPTASADVSRSHNLICSAPCMQPKVCLCSIRASRVTELSDRTGLNKDTWTVVVRRRNTNVLLQITSRIVGNLSIPDTRSQGIPRNRWIDNVKEDQHQRGSCVCNRQRNVSKIDRQSKV